jgi:hypothetical protein
MNDQLPELLTQFEALNIEYIAMFKNDQYYVVITSDQYIRIYSVVDLTRCHLQHAIEQLTSATAFGLFTCHSSLIIVMCYDQILCLDVHYQGDEDLFHIQNMQTVSIPNREDLYVLQWICNERFLIIEQRIPTGDDPYLNDLRVFICDQNRKLSKISEPIAFIKSRMSRTGKVIGFRAYTFLPEKSNLWIASQGNILHLRLPSYIAELDTRSDYHCWMRHALALYQRTTEKLSLSIIITRLVVRKNGDSCLVSGGSDGSIVLWFMTQTPTHTILESIHSDEVRQTMTSAVYAHF